MAGAVRADQVILSGMMGILLIYAILSWVQPYSPIYGVLQRLADPLVAPIRKVVPLIAMWTFGADCPDWPAGAADGAQLCAGWRPVHDCRSALGGCPGRERRIALDETSSVPSLL
jgi:hypothetical protein